jgi:hypothetical protein
MREFELQDKAGVSTEDMKVEAMCEQAITACDFYVTAIEQDRREAVES